MSQGIVFDGIANLKRVTAHLTVFDIGVTTNREVQDHRDLFAAKGTDEGVFHDQVRYRKSLSHDKWREPRASLVVLMLAQRATSQKDKEGAARCPSCSQNMHDKMCSFDLRSKGQLEPFSSHPGY